MLSNGLEFREYVAAYTNAGAILREDFRDTEDLDGLFSGFDPEKVSYDTESWMYEGTETAPAAGQRDQPVRRRIRSRGRRRHRTRRPTAPRVGPR